MRAGRRFETSLLTCQAGEKRIPLLVYGSFKSASGRTSFALLGHSFESNCLKEERTEGWEDLSNAVEYLQDGCFPTFYPRCTNIFNRSCGDLSGRLLQVGRKMVSTIMAGMLFSKNGYVIPGKRHLPPPPLQGFIWCLFAVTLVEKVFLKTLGGWTNKGWEAAPASHTGERD